MCLKPQNSPCFLQDNQFEGSPVYVYLQNECFPIYLLGIRMNVCWNPQNSASFPTDDQVEGSNAKVYLQNECFPIYLLGIPKNVCWNPQNRVHFPEMINLRAHMPRFKWKMNISHLSPWNPHDYVLKSSEQDLFFQDDQFEGSHA